MQKKEVKKEMKNKIVGLDTETISLENRTLVGFSIAYDNFSKYYPIAHNKVKNVDKKEALIFLQNIIENNKIVMHNSAFDIPVLVNGGIPLGSFKDVEDTLVIANLLNENERHGLKKMTKKYLHHQMTELKEIVGTGKKRISVADADNRILKYASEDSEYTLKLFNYLYPRLKQDDKVFKLYTEIEKPLLMVVSEMHLEGITIDALSVLNIENLCARKVKKALERLEYLMPNVNYNSTKQLREFFINKEMMPIIKETKKGSPAVDKEVLTKYAETNGAAKLLIEYRKYNKILTTFIPMLTPTVVNIADYRGKIHPSFNQSGTTSGRFSCSKPNVQQIPKDDEFNIRECFIAGEGNILIGFDFSQIELRIAAHLSQDFNLMKAYKNDEDIHAQTAKECTCSRKHAKIIEYSMLYGAYYKRLAKSLNVPEREAQIYMENFWKTYSGLADYIERIRTEVKTYRYVTTIMGRKRRLTKDYMVKDDYDKGREIRSLINATIQGSCADFVKKAMVDIQPQLKALGGSLVMTVHDELIAEVPKNMATKAQNIMSKCMINATKILSVPVKVEGGAAETWQQIH